MEDTYILTDFNNYLDTDLAFVFAEGVMEIVPFQPAHVAPQLRGGGSMIAGFLYLTGLTSEAQIIAYKGIIHQVIGNADHLNNIFGQEAQKFQARFQQVFARLEKSFQYVQQGIIQTRHLKSYLDTIPPCPTVLPEWESTVKVEPTLLDQIVDARLAGKGV